MKVGIIGHIGDDAALLAEALIRKFEEKTGEKVELVHVNHDQDYSIPEELISTTLGIRNIQTPDLIDHSFYPKAKHCPKGHERPYKYHR